MFRSGQLSRGRAGWLWAADIFLYSFSRSTSDEGLGQTQSINHFVAPRLRIEISNQKYPAREQFNSEDWNSTCGGVVWCVVWCGVVWWEVTLGQPRQSWGW